MSDQIGDSKLHVKEEDYLAPNAHEERASGGFKHYVTDWFCLFLFFAALAPFAWIFTYTAANGDMRRLYHGYDFLGNLCGVEPGVEAKGLLYWCPHANNSMGLDLAHPICVQSCPTNITTSHWCYEDRILGNPQFQDAGANANSPYRPFEQTNSYVFSALADYPSTAFMGRYCYPTDTALLAQLTASIQSNPAYRIATGASELEEAWFPLLIVTLLAAVLGFAYLLLLDLMACCLVYTAIAIMVLFPLISGTTLIIAWFNDGLDGVPSSGDGNVDLVAGSVLLVIFAGFAVLACCAQEAINKAILCVEFACECIMHYRSLLLAPLLEVAVKVVTLFFLGIGFLWLLSCGDISRTSLQEYAMLPGSDINGVARSFTYTEQEWYAIFYYLFIFFWAIEIVTALSQFTIAYSVQLWYFTPYVGEEKMDTPSCPLPRGYYIGMRYHMGSLAFGAFLVAVLRIVRIILGFIARQAQGQGNAAVSCLANCCQCCLTCFQKFVEFLNKNAYMDIAINSNSFITAARRAFQILTSEVASVILLNGACWIFELTGIAAITAVGTWLSWLMLVHVPTFSDPTSESYISEPLIVCAVAGVICFIVAAAFMSVFDMVADTILYCHAVEMRRRAPPLGWYADVTFTPHALHENAHEAMHAQHDIH